MKCDDVQLMFGAYWDMNKDGEDRFELEAHLLECEQCATEFNFWQQSEKLIHEYSKHTSFIGPADHVNRSVMERIYMEQAWYMPVPGKSYHFTKSFRRNAALLIAACMAMFACSFFIFIFDYKDVPSQVDMHQLTGLMEAANASSDNEFLTAGFYAEVPVASISDPFVLKVVPAFPQYYVALSLLGLVMALLMLNWLSRTRN